MTSLIDCHSHLIRQGINLIAPLDDLLYSEPVAPCFNTSIGEHLRHVHDFYQCFFRDWTTGCVNYHLRRREFSIEIHLGFAIKALEQLLTHFAEMPADAATRPLQVILEGTSADASLREGASSVARELDFLLSHTVHHYALIAIQCNLLNIDVDSSFGVAPSTLRFRESSQP